MELKLGNGNNNVAIEKFEDIFTFLGIAQLHTTTNLTLQHSISFSLIDN
jgi:hypothetical protein